MNTPPIFLCAGDHILNVTQIKWVGVSQRDTAHTPQVLVEFITGGSALIHPDISIQQFQIALTAAMKEHATH